MEYTKDLSIVISLFNEEESLAELVAWIETVMLKEGYSYEILMIDDGSRDSSHGVDQRAVKIKNKKFFHCLQRVNAALSFFSFASNAALEIGDCCCQRANLKSFMAGFKSI